MIKLRLKRRYAMLIIALSTLVVFTIIMGISYAFFTTRVTTKDYVMYTGSLQVTFSNNGNGINLQSVKPMTNQEGLATTGYNFNILNNGTLDAKYQVRIELDANNEIPIEYIKIAYTKTRANDIAANNEYSTPVLLSDLNDSMIFISNQEIDSNKLDSFNIKLWLDLSAPNDMQGKTFKAKIVVDAIQNIDAGYVFASIPVIHLNPDANGNIHMNLKLNDTFTDPGVASVKDDKDNLGVQSINVEYEYFDGQNFSSTNSVDTSTAGVYYIVYTVTDSDNQTGTAIRIVTVNNTNQTPTITLKGTDPYNVSQNSTYVDPGVNVESGNRAIAIGDVNTKATGQYIVRYIVIDQYGNMNSITRTVNVIVTFKNTLLANNTLITASPTLTTSSNNTSDASGLYAMDVTNGFGGADGTTYYFRGNVTNNYVSFAGKTWRIVRINEDGTLRLILDGSTAEEGYVMTSTQFGAANMYYSNSTAKSLVDTWYTSNITGTNAEKVATGNYFCEAAQVVYNSNYNEVSGVNFMQTVSNYTPTLSCVKDPNNYQYVEGPVGLLTVDEEWYAGGYPYSANGSYYLKTGFDFWTMSPAGVTSSSSLAGVWYMKTDGTIDNGGVNTSTSRRLRPVINLVSTVQATGTGTQADPYVIQ